MGYCTDAIRIVIICGIVACACLHIAILIVPNWWYFAYGTWVQDTTGVERLNGGLFRVCQYDRKTMNGEWTCHGYDDGPTGLKDTRGGHQPESDLLPMTRGFVITALLPSVPVVVLISLTFRVLVRQKLVLMLISFALLLLQTLLMIGGVGTAHEWIIQPYCDGDCWRDLYLYEWCFHAACVLIGGYMISGLLTLATIYFDRRDAKQAAKEEYEDSEADGDAETVQ